MSVKEIASLVALANQPSISGAPVQASWIVYPGTTGLKAIGYYISNQYHLPSDAFDWQFTEKIVSLLLLAVFLPYKYSSPVRQLPALKDRYLNFGSFNRTNKILRSVVSLWSKLLRALPNARLLIGAMPKTLGDIFLEEVVHTRWN